LLSATLSIFHLPTNLNAGLTRHFSWSHPPISTWMAKLLLQRLVSALTICQKITYICIYQTFLIWDNLFYFTLFLAVAITWRSIITKLKRSFSKGYSRDEIWICKDKYFQQLGTTEYLQFLSKPCKITSDGPGSIFCGSGRVSHLWFEFDFGKFP